MGKKLKRLVRNLEVIDINTKGMGVAKDESGAVYFIKNTIPGDHVEALVYKKRRGYFEAETTQLLEESPYRTKPTCQHFGLCGGCKWQHLDYQKQLHYKEKGVLQNLSKIGKVTPRKVYPILAAPEAYWYRNKLEFSFSNNRWLTSDEIESGQAHNRLGIGFHKPGRWDKIVSIERCHLQPDPSNDIRNTLFQFAVTENISFFDLHEQKGFLRNLMVRNTLAGEFMVLLQFFEENIEAQQKVLNFLKDTFPQITSLQYCINQKANDSIYDQNLILFSGTDHLIEHMEELRFKITAKSFYQTNPKQAYFLYQLVRDWTALKGNEIVYDLYTGTGTIALFLATNCQKVVGIESVPEAVEDAKYNAKMNQIDNALFEVGDMKKLFNEVFISRHGAPDVVVADPPRDGMHPNVVKQLLHLNAPKIVYVSCNSATQARDLALLNSQYTVEQSQAVDLFPQTGHVENVVLLCRK